MEYERRRLENIRRNRTLVRELGLENNHGDAATEPAPSSKSKGPAPKRRKVIQTTQPTRSSARIANAPARPLYTEDTPEDGGGRRKRPQPREADKSVEPLTPPPHLDALMAGWSSWEPTEPPPTRDEEGTYHFASHPDFAPNKSPESIMREGAFGGAYWRPLYSRKLGVTVADDWRELPASWTAGLAPSRFLAAPAYDPSANKYGVACGQSIEEWEAAGWIAHEHDVRGWFQWYCRFWMGRRCADDDRQVARWRRCVGPSGRFRRTLLRKYVQNGIRHVTDEDDGDDDDGSGERKGDVSPVVHQTCHHWAWEVRQEALDRFWRDGK